MITAFQLILFPLKKWERIATSQRSVVWILFVHLLPYLLAGVAIEYYSLVHRGEWRVELTALVKVEENTAVRYAATQAGLLLVSIFLGAQILRWISHSFQVRPSFVQCFTVLAYGFSPIILARYADAIPALPTWICWMIGALLAASVLYHGVGLALRPEQTKGFGLYIVCVLIVVFSGGLAHFIALAVLRGKILH